MAPRGPQMPDRLRPPGRAERPGLRDIPELVKEALAVARNRMILSGLLNPNGQAIPGDFALWTEEEALQIAEGLTPADRAMLENVSREGELGAVIAPIAPAERLMGAHRRVLPIGMHLGGEDSIRFRGTHELHPEQGLAIRGFTLGLGDVRPGLPFDVGDTQLLYLPLRDRLALHAEENPGVTGLGLTFQEYMALQEDRLGVEPLDAENNAGVTVATVLNGEVADTTVLLGHWNLGTHVQDRLLSSNFLSQQEPRRTAFRPWVRLTGKAS